jgi:hypothetical protein
LPRALRVDASEAVLDGDESRFEKGGFRTRRVGIPAAHTHMCSDRVTLSTRLEHTPGLG